MKETEKTMKKRRYGKWLLGLLFTAVVVPNVVPIMVNGTELKNFSSDQFQFGTIPEKSCVLSQDVEVDGTEWNGTDENINITGVGTKEVNSCTIPYSDKKSAFYGAKDFAREKSEYYQQLTGKDSDWQLVVVGNDAEAKKLGEFQNTDYKQDESAGWKTVQLPASWTTQGFDYSIYTNTVMPFQEDKEVGFPLAPTKKNPVGLYRKSFTVKDSMLQNNGKVYLTFGGVESAYYVYVNGHIVGYSEDSYNPHSYDITKYLNPKGEENLLAVKVFKFCDGTWLEDQDMIYDGGIFRDVYLTSTPGVAFSDDTVNTDLSSDFQKGELQIRADVENLYQDAADNLAIEAALYNENGEVVSTQDVSVGSIASGQKESAKITLEIDKPALWDCDHPNLYTLVLSLYDADAKLHYVSVSQNVGFRKLDFTRTEIKDRDSYESVTTDYKTVKLNGKRLILKGVNRHDTDLETGKYVSHKIYEKDITMMKQNNINALRTSHYANDDYLYYLCDKYGIYMMCETNNESHAVQNIESKLKKLKTAAMDRQKTAYARLKNVTANLIWSIGNESTSQNADGSYADGMFGEMIQYFKDRDTTRMVHYEGICKASGETAGGVDLHSQMYSTVAGFAQRGSMSNHMPAILCEYNHAMGNGVGNIKEYWDTVRSNENCLGGFIWDWVDQSRKIKITSDSKWNYYGQKNAHTSGLYDLDGYFIGYGGDWGDRVNSGNFCQNGLISADRDPQPELKEVKYQYQDFWFTGEQEELTDKKIHVKNESFSKNLNDYKLEWKLYEDGNVIDQGELSENLEARQEKDIEIPFTMPENKKSGAEYYLNISVIQKEDNNGISKGAEIAYAQFKVSAQVSQMTRKVDGSDVNVTETDNMYQVTGSDFSFSIAKDTGVISDYVKDGVTLLKKGPVPTFDRAKLDNDPAIMANTGISDTLELSGTIQISKDGYGRQVITIPYQFTYKGDVGKVIQQYSVESSGAVIVNTKYDFTELLRHDFTKVGSTLELDKEYENIYWYGNGDGESYSDRKTSSRVGIYSSTVSDMFYPFPKPQDCGNLTDVRWLKISTKDDKNGILLVGQKNVTASALHFGVKEMREAHNVVDLKESNTTYVTFDAAVSGTGNASCGERPLNQYRVKEESYEYTFTILPVNDQTDCMSTSKLYKENTILPAQDNNSGIVTPPSTLPSTAVPTATPTTKPGTALNATSQNKKVSIAKVSGLKVKPGKKCLKCSWKKQKKVKYIIAYSTKKAALKKYSTKKVKGVKKISTKKNKICLNKLSKKKKYYIKVRAYQITGSKKIYGSWSNVVVQKTK